MPEETLPADTALCEEMHEASAGESFETSLEPIDSLEEYPGNARRGDVEVIADSIRRNGQYKPLVVQTSTRRVLVGNHTLRALKRLGRAKAPVWWQDVDDDTARRIVLIDNRSSDLAEYDDAALIALLKEAGSLEGTGFDQEAMDDLLEGMADDLAGLDDRDSGDDDAVDEEPEAATLLALASVTVDEPTHQPKAGTRWRLGPHLLVIAKVADEHHLWSGDLAGRIFAPYPEPYITCSVQAHKASYLLVQPNKYLAGHLLDKHEALYPGTIEQLT